MRANLISTKVNASHRKSTQVHASLACEQALRSRMGRKESGKRKVGVGVGKKAGREGEGESLLTKDCSRHSAPV